MAWIESHQSLRTHRKTGRLARRLGVSKVTAIGHLHCLWWWCLDNAPDGDLAGIDYEDIADGAEWEGDPGDLIVALAYAGFIDDPDGERAETRIHGWHDYAGKLIERREKDAERKRAARQKDDPPPSDAHAAHVPRMSDGQRADGVRTVPNRTVPNLTVPNLRDTPPNPPTPEHSEPAPPDGGGRVRAVPKPTTLNARQQERFDRWYQNYPRKQHRPEAERAWKKIDPDDEMTMRLIADLHERKLGRKWADGIIEHPATYLNQHAWDDDIEPQRGAPTPLHNSTELIGKDRERAEVMQRVAARRGYGPVGPDADPPAHGGGVPRLAHRAGA